jgi:hypothetical protein
MSIKSHYRPTNDQRRRRVAPAAGFGVVAAGAIGAALLSAAVAPAAQAVPDVDPFEDFLPSNSIFQPDAAILDAAILTYPNGAFWAGIFDNQVDGPITNVGPLAPPGAEPDPFEDLLGMNSGAALQLDTVFDNYQPALAVLLDNLFDGLPPPDNDALADLTQAFGATGAAYIAGLEQAITGVPITDAMADMAIASAGLGPF